MIKTPLSTVIGGAFWTPGATILGGASKSFNQIIKSLFANSEQGFVYDPNDLTTMFQDAAGTVPVTGAGQPVGLMLDKSKGLALSSELKQSALARMVGTAPVATYNPATGAGAVNRVDISNQSFIVFNDAVGKKWYKVSITNNSAALISLRNASMVGVDSTLANVLPNTTFSGYVYVTLGYMLGIAASTGECGFTVNSIKEMAGNNANQATSSMRPLLVASPQRLDFDTVDDKLITTLPTQLTGCTVIRSVPNVGTQILTNQTIPTTYNDNTDHCGLIVINRALTATETAAITSEFNKRAGV